MSYGNYGVPPMPDKNGLVTSYLSYIRLYRDPNRVKVDTGEVFRYFPNLHPYYQQSDRGTVIYLKGTIPIIYNNFNYYLPIKITLPTLYPEHGPHIALDPTPEMFVVKNHPQVDEYGTCILKNWNHLTSVSQVLKYLCDTFSYMPPLQSRGTGTQQTIQQPPQPQPQPLPQLPQQQQQQPQQPHRGLPTTPTQNIPINSNIQNNNSPPPYGSSPTAANWNTQQPPSYDHSMANKQQQQNTIKNSPPTKPLPPNPPPVVVDEKAELIQKCTIKIQEQLSQFYETLNTEITDFKSFNQSMEKRLKDLNLQKDNLAKDLEYSEKSIHNITSESEKLEKIVKDLEGTDSSVDVDLVLGPKSVLSKQLLTLASENQTIEDILYFMDKALHSGTVSLEEYLKTVRSLSRDQFMVKATIKKVQAAIAQTYELALQQLNLTPQNQSSPKSPPSSITLLPPNPVVHQKAQLSQLY
ncbi:hypothetical protein DLAC_11086 [Tieghemostelium lacteum]|uniref:Uncharacterized protein n=1 Tax=Tieghemostelium lacteum TaxID=361077 RepID=A0A151Z365_TIELA|nr:hypothetical protein DLAC_11086 [Tieghemostelium lacteum]|eukprot:KYQ88389.1 hypothetical protein DLAC_11086 [Tieghemostelium lacteum]